MDADIPAAADADTQLKRSQQLEAELMLQQMMIASESLVQKGKIRWYHIHIYTYIYTYTYTYIYTYTYTYTLDAR